MWWGGGQARSDLGNSRDDQLEQIKLVMSHHHVSQTKLCFLSRPNKQVKNSFFLFQKNKDQNEWLDSYNRALLEIKEEIKSELVTMINQERRLQSIKVKYSICYLDITEYESSHEGGIVNMYLVLLWEAALQSFIDFVFHSVIICDLCLQELPDAVLRSW